MKHGRLPKFNVGIHFVTTNLHNIPYLNDPSKAEQVLSGSILREMNLYLEIIRNTSINPVKKIGDLASLFHRVNTLSTPKYHPLFSFSPVEGEKVLPGSHISNSYCRPCLHALILLPALILREQAGREQAGGQNCLKPCYQELLSPGGRGKKVRGDFFPSLAGLIISKIMQSVKSVTAKRIIKYYQNNNPNTQGSNEHVLVVTQGKSKKHVLSATRSTLEPYKANPNKKIGIQHTRPKYKIWQKGAYDFNILTDEKLEEKINYIHQNPYKDSRIKNPETYPFSSERFYLYEEEGPLKIDGLEV